LTNKTVTLLNNYFGYYFNTVDDLFVHDNGDIFFTDPQYSWFNALTDRAPQLETASYRFMPSTGAVSVINDDIVQPNGIAIAPVVAGCPRTVYISDTGAIAGTTQQSLGPQGTEFNTTGKRTIYAFDLSANGKHLLNKRPVYLAQDWVPDGLKVAANGYIVTGAGKGVDVLDSDGTLLVRVQTNFTVQNFAWTGANYEDLWIVGNSGVARVKWALEGQVLK
jgi:sugar lactone lactonase YvrE